MTPSSNDRLTPENTAAQHYSAYNDNDHPDYVIVHAPFRNSSYYNTPSHVPTSQIDQRKIQWAATQSTPMGNNPWGMPGIGGNRR
jgi:hypothetical protein